METQKHKVFISYAHKDRDLMMSFRDNFLKYQEGSTGNIIFEFWDDRQLVVGDDFTDIIFNKIKEVNIGIFLVSPNLLKSAFCNSKELIKFYYEKLNGTAIISPIIVEPCLNKTIYEELLQKLQFFTPEFENYNIENDLTEEFYLNSVVPYSYFSTKKNEEKLPNYFRELYSELKKAIHNAEIIKKSGKTIKIEYGALLAAIPNEMIKGIPAFCEVYISYDEDVLYPTKAARKGDYHYLEINSKMIVDLVPFPMGIAKISDESDKLQVIEQGKQSKWSYFVQPIKKQTFNIQCKVKSGLKNRIIETYPEEVQVVDENIHSYEGTQTKAKDTLLRTINIITLVDVTSDQGENDSIDGNEKSFISKYLKSIITILTFSVVIFLLISPPDKIIKKNTYNKFNLNIKLLPDKIIKEDFVVFVKDSNNKIDTLKCINNKCTSNKMYSLGDSIHIVLNSKNYIPINYFYPADSIFMIKLKFKFIDTIYGTTKYNNKPLINVELSIDGINTRFHSDIQGKFVIEAFSLFGGKTQLTLRARKNNYYANGHSEIKLQITPTNSKKSVKIAFDNIDTDADGLFDSKDKCPKDYGPKCTDGCPDKDNDCISDSVDICTHYSGISKFNGCNSQFQKDLLSGKVMTIHIETDKELTNLINCRSIRFINPNIIKIKDYNGKKNDGYQYVFNLNLLNNIELPKIICKIDVNGFIYRDTRRIGFINSVRCSNIVE